MATLFLVVEDEEEDDVLVSSAELVFAVLVVVSIIVVANAKETSGDLVLRLGSSGCVASVCGMTKAVANI